MKIQVDHLKLVSVPDANQVQIHLVSVSTAKHKPMFFEISFDDFGKMMIELHKFARQYNIPIRPSRPPSGKPALAVVKRDD